MRKIFILSAFLFSFGTLHADEGMWLLNMLQQLDLQEKGFELSDEDIYSINKSSIKDAVVGLGMEGRPFRFFCTAEIVSDQGLLFTNHHCGFDLIQNHTSISDNLLEEGFWADDFKDELQNEGITASRMVLLKDVSDYILGSISDTVSEKEKNEIIDSLSNLLISSVEDTSHYEASVKSFYENNRYYMFVYETFKDIRLVGAPPNSIGKYGGDTDNWMWPRHTGDFSVLRIYADSTGKPAEYSKDNVPYKPKHFLPISIKGYEKGDFAMIMGFPGSTERYATSFGVQETHDILNKEAVAIRSLKLDVYKKYMDKDPEVKIQYASKWARTSNYWKYFIGQNKGIRSLDVIANKEKEESYLQEWIDADPLRKEKYGNALEGIDSLYMASKYINKVKQYYYEGFFNTSDMLFLPYEFLDIREMYSEGDSIEAILKERVKVTEALNDFYNEFNIELDKELFTRFLILFRDNIDKEYYPDFFATVKKKYKGNIGAYIDKIYAKSLFGDRERVEALLTGKDMKSIKKDLDLLVSDPMFELMRSVIGSYYDLKDQVRPLDDEIAKKREHFMAALLEMKGDSVMYPDANSTLRLTYGYIGDYIPRDAVKYKHYTTIEGVIEKEDPENEEFFLDEKLKELYEQKDYGRYAENGTVNVCFLSNNDITGGNSGSPVLNSKGELIGIAFDGNWEAMSGDIIFEPELQKTISVDIRYVLFIIDKFAGAQRLIDELVINE